MVLQVSHGLCLGAYGIFILSHICYILEYIYLGIDFNCDFVSDGPEAEMISILPELARMPSVFMRLKQWACSIRSL
mgnify:CR=1 FL=1